MIIKVLVILAICGQFLSWNPTLARVAWVRQNYPVKYAISKEIKINEYECLVGVPFGYGYLIGQEIYFWDSLTLRGPWLVVDVESKVHAGMMDERNLIADINCRRYVHLRGKLIIAEKTGRSLHSYSRQ
jgi:hypothetical protein